MSERPVDPPEAHCNFDRTMALLGERHVLMLLYLLYLKSPRGFNELKTAGEVNTATLSCRLKGLQALGIVHRKVIRTVPRRVEYGITPMGRGLLKIFRTMIEWRSEYDLPSRKSSVRGKATKLGGRERYRPRAAR
jgi:DNA-binding HxlR family transcriptional regulator